VYHGVLLSGGIFTTIDVPVPGNPDAGAFGIDPSGTFVVGFYSPTAADINGLLEHGFLLTGGIFTTTIDYPLAGVGVIEALGVNPQGDIVGDYLDSAGVDHGFLFGREKKKRRRSNRAQGRGGPLNQGPGASPIGGQRFGSIGLCHSWPRNENGKQIPRCARDDGQASIQWRTRHSL
jgi:hypothetical protein